MNLEQLVSQPKKHTPGPWRIARGVHDPANFWIQTDKEDWQATEIIATLPYESPQTEENEANAVLMASSPDLLEALEDLLRDGFRTETLFGITSPTDEAEAALEKARAAIRKARGF